MASMSRRSFLKALGAGSVMSLLEWRTLLAEDAAGLSKSPTAQVPNVLIVVLDTLAANHMSLYGYPRETTPRISEFAKRATVYHAHYASGNFTTPGTASLLTGAYPWSHRAFCLKAPVTRQYQHHTLFSLLGKKGYSRMAYTHNWVAQVFLHQFRSDIDTLVDPPEFFLFKNRILPRLLSRDADSAYRSEQFALNIGKGGFPGLLLASILNRARRDRKQKRVGQEYKELYPAGVSAHEGALFVLEDAIDGIDALIRHAPQPYLGYFHLLPPHDPYCPRREFVDLFQDQWEPTAKEPHFFSEGYSNESLNKRRLAYDRFVAHADAEFGRLIDSLRSAGKLENTYVILTSDHGEMFERGIQGHQTEVLYEPLIRVPLLIAKPRQAAREDVYALTSCVDLVPTLLAACGLSIPSWCEGEVLPTGSELPNKGRTVFSMEAKRSFGQAPLAVATVALLKDQYKLIHYLGYQGYEDKYELYHLGNDPGELVDLYSSERAVATALEDELAYKLRQVNEPYSSR